MNDNHHHITYTAADIRRYVLGELSPGEMHAMEKAALDDPFLADAIEGMQEAIQTHGDAAVTAPLQELHSQLQSQKSRPARVIVFRWWQAAAAAVIVMAGALWIYNFSSTKENTTVTVAQRQEAPEAATTPAQQDAVAADPAPDKNQSATAPAVQAPTNQPQAAQAPGQPSELKAGVPSAVQPPAQTPAKTNAVKHPATPAPLEEDAASPLAATIDTTMKLSDEFPAKQKVAPKTNQEAFNKIYNKHARALANKKMQASHKDRIAEKASHIDSITFDDRDTEFITIAGNNNRQKSAVVGSTNLSGFVKGRVTDPFLNPIANARITMPNNATYNMLTDKRGYFELPANDTAVDVAVNVSGYGTQNFRLQNNASLNELRLQPANAPLNEVVTAGYSANNRNQAVQTNYPRVMVQDAEPVFGWMAYDQYLQTNKRHPAGHSILTGNVVVSFTVNKKGELSDFNIEQSLSQPYDEEAIRLISQGPAWKLVRGRKAKITVIVKF